MNKSKLRSFSEIEKAREAKYPDYAHIYVDLLPDDGLILKHLANNLNTTSKVVLSIPKDRLPHRYAEGNWTIKEILRHIVDGTSRGCQIRTGRLRESAPSPESGTVAYFRPYTIKSMPPAPDVNTSIERFIPGAGYQPFSFEGIQDELVERTSFRVSSHMIVQIGID